MDPLFVVAAGHCAICLTSGAPSLSDDAQYDSFQVRCPRCGFYRTSSAAQDLLLDNKVTNEQRASLSGWVRENEGVTVLSNRVPHLLLRRTPTPIEKGDKLLLWLAKQHPQPGASFRIDTSDPETLARAWAWTPEELAYVVIDYSTNERGFYNPGSVEGTGMTLKVAPRGWARVAELGLTAPDRPLGFIAMWFDESLDGLRDRALIPAIQEAGYDHKIMNLHDHVNRIDDEIVALLRRTHFIVADFTGNRGGVYFEAGFALGLGRQVIWTCDKTTLARGDLHFDVDHFNFLTWTESDLDGFKKRLVARIANVVGWGPKANPA